MKGLKTLASALVLLGLTVSALHTNATNKPNFIKSAVTSNYLAKDNQKNSSNLENAFALIKSKDYAGAVEAFSKVIQTEPNNQYAYVGRGLANFSL